MSVLQNGYGECYGANYTIQPPDKQYYGGNFWWAKSEFIKSRKPFTIKDKRWRYTAETWLLDGLNGEFYNAYRINSDLQPIPLPIGFLSDNLPERIVSKVSFYFEYQIWGVTKIIKRLVKRLKPARFCS